MKSKYIKLKKIVNKLYSNTIKSIDLINNEITYDTVRGAIRSLNKFNLLSKKASKGHNNLNENLIDNSYFSIREYNTSLISSLVYSEDLETENIVKYIFNDVPYSITSSLINKYSKSIDDKFIDLIDSYKYQVFSTIINEFKESTKSICEIYNSEKYTKEEIVPLQIYIFEDSWYICVFDIKYDVIKLINSEHIDSIRIKENFFYKFISSNEIDDYVNSYLQEQNKEEVIYLTLSAETLSLLDKFKLITEFEIFEKKLDFEKYRLNFVDTQAFVKKNTKNQEKTKPLPISLEDFKETIEFEYYSYRKYIVKVKLSKNKIDMIKNLFPNIKINEAIKNDRK